VREALDRAAERIETRFDDQPLVEASIRHTIGETYRGLRLPEESIKHLQRSVQLRTNSLGKHDDETRQVMRDLLAGLYEGGRGAEGDVLSEELLALDIEMGGADSAGAMDTLHLHVRYGSDDVVGETETRIASLNSILAWNRRERGIAHLETLSVMHTLANIFIYNHRIEEAKPVVEEIWEVTKSHFEPSDPETLDAMLGLAMLYGRIDRLDEAVALLQEAVQILRDTRPRNFADTGIFLTHLGIHLRKIDRDGEAASAFIEGYEILSSSLGPESGWAQGTARFLYDHYEKIGDTEQARLWRGRFPKPVENRSNE